MKEYIICYKDTNEMDMLWGYNFTDALKRSDLLEKYEEGEIAFIREDYID